MFKKYTHFLVHAVEMHTQMYTDIGYWFLFFMHFKFTKKNRLKFLKLCYYSDRGVERLGSQADGRCSAMQCGEEKGKGWVPVLAEFFRPGLPSWPHETGAN